MDKKRTVILTGTGGELGTGHLQRMLNLAVTINSGNSLSASVILQSSEFPVSDELRPLLVDAIPAGTDLIIRDMRNSSAECISELKQFAPVLVIDDSGAGRDAADYRLTLLPVPSEKAAEIRPDLSLFLYGYNFTEGLKKLNPRKTFHRDIDVTIYAGFNPPHELIETIQKAFPENSVSLLLSGGKALTLSGDNSFQENSYAEILMRSKTVITHFGLTMFEAFICGCRIAALNPSPYHTVLTDMVKEEFGIIYMSEYGGFSPEILKIIIQREIEQKRYKTLSPEMILERVNSGTSNFIEYLNKILTD
jgi:spore coat polysaccharide biosynthesis predicted glycosyltransferase SpsG